MSRYLGLDFSTQQLKCIVLNESLDLEYKNAVNFSKDLPHYNTQDGVVYLPNQQVVSPPLMWIEAVELLFRKMKSDEVDFSKIVSISGAAQQHGTVYWKTGAQSVLNKCGDLFERPLHNILKDCFSVDPSPIWMDSSTSTQCRKLMDHLGGDESYAKRFGTRLYERFGAAQILKLIETNSIAFENTEHICQISDFASSLFLGDYSLVDRADVGGTGLLDVHSKNYDPHICELKNNLQERVPDLWKYEHLSAILISPDLLRKLGSIQPSFQTAGFISSYFGKRFGFPDNCEIVPFTGDNPATLVGMKLREGDVCLSLGSSDVLIFWNCQLPSADSATLCTVFLNPIQDDHYMSILCYKNGSFPRERICKEFANHSWDIFSDYLKNTPRGNNGIIGVFFDNEEITPHNVFGSQLWNAVDEPIDLSNLSHGQICRAVIEGQIIAKKSHLHDLNININESSRVFVTGGASVNEAIVQIIADVFSANVYTASTENSAALGGAYRAKYCFEKRNGLSTFDEMVGHLDYDQMIASPSEGSVEVYAPMIDRYKKLESKLMPNSN